MPLARKPRRLAPTRTARQPRSSRARARRVSPQPHRPREVTGAARPGRPQPSVDFPHFRTAPRAARVKVEASASEVRSGVEETRARGPAGLRPRRSTASSASSRRTFARSGARSSSCARRCGSNAPGGEIGIRMGLKSPRGETPVQVRVLPRASSTAATAASSSPRYRW